MTYDIKIVIVVDEFRWIKVEKDGMLIAKESFHLWEDYRQWIENRLKEIEENS